MIKINWKWRFWNTNIERRLNVINVQNRILEENNEEVDTEEEEYYKEMEAKSLRKRRVKDKYDLFLSLLILYKLYCYPFTIYFYAYTFSKTMILLILKKKK